VIVTNDTTYFKVDVNYSKKSFITKTSAIDGKATFSLFTFFQLQPTTIRRISGGNVTICQMLFGRITWKDLRLALLKGE
jgi:hypothetical protein